MKTIDIYARSYNEIYSKVEASILEHLKVIKQSDPEFGYIRLVSDNGVSIFIRMLPTTNYEDNSIMYWVNSYVHYKSGKENKDSLFFSFPYDETEGSNCIQNGIACVMVYILMFFGVDEDSEFNEKRHVGFVCGVKTYRNIELETKYPSAITDLNTFANFIKGIVNKLNRNNPSITITFCINMAGIEANNQQNGIESDGVFFITFIYSDQLTGMYGEPVYSLVGSLPGYDDEDARFYLSGAITISQVEKVIKNNARFYFSLRSVCLPGEYTECWIRDLPYFQKYI